MIKKILILILLFLCIKHFTKDNIEQYSDPVYGSMVTIPSRKEHLERVISSILSQLDHLYIYLNYGEEDDIPEYLLNNNKITIQHSKDTGDLSSNGRLYFISELDLKGYLFTLDDDIIYSKDYVKKMINKIDEYDRKVVVTYHGGILKSPVKKYYAERNMIDFRRLNKRDTYVNIGGVGVTAYHSSLMKLSLDEFKTLHRADLYFALACQRRKIPIIVVKHEKDELEGIIYDYTLWGIEESENNNGSESKDSLLNKNTKLANSITWELYEL